MAKKKKIRYPGQASVGPASTGIRRGIDAVKRGYRKNVPESFRTVMPGFSDVEDAMFLQEQLGPEGTWGGRAIAAGAIALPVIGSKALKPLLKKGKKHKSVASDIENVFNRDPLSDIEKRMIDEYRINETKKLSSIAEKGREWMTDWYSSPSTFDRYGKVFGANDPNIIPHATRELENVRNIPSFDAVAPLSEPRLGGRYTTKSVRAHGDPHGQEIQMFPERFKNPLDRTSADIHEFTHSLTEAEDLIMPQLRKELKAPFRNVDESTKILSDKEPFGVSEGASARAEYLLNPTEIYARANEIRYRLGLKPEDTFTTKHIEETKELLKDSRWGKGIKELLDFRKSDKAFTKMMNTIPVAGAVAVGSKALLKDERKQGGQIMKRKCGGRIKYKSGGSLPKARRRVDNITPEEIDILQSGGMLSSILQGAGTGFTLGGPWAALAGAGVGAVSGFLNQDQDQDLEELQPRIIKPVNPYTNARPNMPLKSGGSLTQYQGPAHEDGGMNIGPAEVEGGENEFNMVVNSDTKKITRGNVRQYGIDYGGGVPIYDRHIGKSPAKVGEEIDRKYKRFYPLDPFNVSERESLMALSDMSEDLADEMEFGDQQFLKSGGRWIQKATASIKRRGTAGKCTPITKPGCTGRAKALAKTFKKIARNRQGGGEIPQGPLYEEMAGRYPDFTKFRESHYKSGSGEKFDDLLRLRDYQSQLTGGIEQEYPDIPVRDILTEAAGRKDPMSILNTSERGESVIGDFGDLSLSPEQIDEYLGESSEDYWKLSQRYAPKGTAGKTETGRQKFGMRSMIMPRLRSDSQVEGDISFGMGPYGYLENKQGGGQLSEKSPEEPGRASFNMPKKGVSRADSIKLYNRSMDELDFYTQPGYDWELKDITDKEIYDPKYNINEYEVPYRQMAPTQMLSVFNDRSTQKFALDEDGNLIGYQGEPHKRPMYPKPSNYEDKTPKTILSKQAGGPLIAPYIKNEKVRSMLRKKSTEGKFISPKHKEYFDFQDDNRQDGGGLFRDPEGGLKTGSILGMAPMATNLLQFGLEQFRPEEQFDYPTITGEEYEPLDPTQTIARATQGFDTAREAARRSGDLTQAGAIQFATESGKAVGDITDRFNLANRQGRNRMAMINQRKKMFNARQRTQSQIDAAANRGAGLTRSSAFLSGIGTGFGQMGRDINMMDAQSRLMDRREKFLERAFPHVYGKKALSAGDSGAGVTVNADEFLPIPDIGAGQSNFNVLAEDYPFPLEDETTYADLYRKGPPYTGR